MGGLCRREKNFSHGLALYWYRQAVRLDWGMYGSFRTFAVENGGAAFIMIYLLFLTVLGWPILTAEFAVGRGSRRSIAQSFSILESEKSNWHCFKWFGIAGNYLLMMFYTMVTGWMMYYAWLAVSGQLEANSKVQSTTEQFADMLANPGTMILWTVIAIAIAFGICALGLQNGCGKGDEGHDAAAHNIDDCTGGQLCYAGYNR